MVAPYTGLDLAPPTSSRPRRRRSLSPGEVLSMLDRREEKNAWRNRRLMMLGLAILTGAPTIVFSLLGVWFVRYAGRSSTDVAGILGCLAGGMIVFSLLFAPFVQRGSRADAIQQFIDSGQRPGGCKDNPFLRLLVALMLAGMLFGAFMCIDALKTTLLRLRLKTTVDRIRCATVLKELLDRPAGISPHMLMRHGEDAHDFRRTLAWLMAQNWADISAQGGHVMLLSPSRRHFRETWTLD